MKVTRKITIELSEAECRKLSGTMYRIRTLAEQSGLLDAADQADMDRLEELEETLDSHTQLPEDMID